MIKLEAMTAHASFFKTGQRVIVTCSVCRMQEDVDKAIRVNGKWICSMEDCRRSAGVKP